MKEIELTRGYVALVDDEDYEELSKHNWCAMTGKREKFYAGRRVRIGFRQYAMIGMHQQIMGTFQTAFQVDHINGDSLNNTRANLRVCSNAENSRNSRKTKRATTSRYKGVCLHKRTQRWLAHIVLNGKQRCLGAFDNEDDAARAYDYAAQELFGEFARVNFPDTPATESPLNWKQLRKLKATSRFKGVSFHHNRKAWRAYIQVNRRHKHLGFFESEVEAALAYDEAAREHFGDFAFTNFPPKKPCEHHVGNHPESLLALTTMAAKPTG